MGGGPTLNNETRRGTELFTSFLRTIAGGAVRHLRTRIDTSRTAKIHNHRQQGAGNILEMEDGTTTTPPSPWSSQPSPPVRW